MLIARNKNFSRDDFSAAKIFFRVVERLIGIPALPASDRRDVRRIVATPANMLLPALERRARRTGAGSRDRYRVAAMSAVGEG